MDASPQRVEENHSGQELASETSFLRIGMLVASRGGTLAQ